MTRTVHMEDIDQSGLTRRLIDFLRDNRSLRVHEPATTGRSPRTAYLNAIAKDVGRAPIFILQITNFVSGQQESTAVTADEAEQILLVSEKTNAFMACHSVMEEVKNNGRRVVRYTQLPPEKIRRH